MNAFESGERKVVPAVLIYAKCEGRILMLHRIGKKHREGKDYHGGKWNGVGGKLELDESPRQAAAREFFEEAGIKLPEERFEPIGVITFPNFKPDENTDWFVSVFTVQFEVGDPGLKGLRSECDEGVFQWVDEAELLHLNLWPGDHVFLPHMLRGEPFFATLWYQAGKTVKTEISIIKSNN